MAKGKGKGKGKGRRKKKGGDGIPPTEAELVPIALRNAALALIRIPGPLVPLHAHTPLHQACVDGNINIVQHLLDNEAAIDIVDAMGSTPLLYAVAYGRTPLVHYLLARGADVNASNDEGMTALHALVLRQEMATVRFLLSLEGLDVNKQTAMGFTALMQACMDGRRDLAELLLGVEEEKAVAKERAAEAARKRAAAKERGEVETSEEEAEAEAEPEEDADAGEKKEEKTEETGGRTWASTHLKDRAGWTALHHAASRGHAEIVRLLLAKGAVVNAVDARTGETALHKAVIQGYPQVVRYLAAADPSLKDNQGMLPIQHAAREGQSVIFQTLVEHGADYSVKDARGWNLLHLASFHGHVAIVKFLVVVLGENLHTNTPDGKKALQLTKSDACKAFMQDRMLGDLQEKVG